MVNLARRCEPTGQQGLRNIKALLNGCLPHGLDQWPESTTSSKQATFAQTVISETPGLTAEESEALHAFLDTSYRRERSDTAFSDFTLQQTCVEQNDLLDSSV